MATSSIFHDFVISDKKTAKRFVDALEASRAFEEKKKQDRNYKPEIQYEEIKDPHEIETILRSAIQRHDKVKV